MVYCALFKDITNSMESEIGTKAMNLSKLYIKKYPIPKGFVIKSNTLNDILLKSNLLEQINSILENTDHRNYSSLLESSKKIEELISVLNIPDEISIEIGKMYKEFSVSEDMKGLNEKAKSMINAGRGDPNVAVRCSPVTGTRNYSASGLHTSILNITGAPALLKAIKSIYMSFYTPEAIYYYMKNSIKTPQMAIIVQEMINSEKSGIVYTANPLTNNLAEFTIEASYGLGESLSKGEVIPDRYRLNIQKGELTEAKVSKKTVLISLDPLNGGTKAEHPSTEEMTRSVLSTNEIKVVCEIADKIQSTLNHPQDIEWAISKRRVYVLQANPISTINRKFDIPENSNSKTEGLIIKGIPIGTKSADGKIKILSSPYEQKDVEENTILIIRNTSLEYLPSIEKAKGIICKNGGQLSNLSKIAREMEIPLIVGTGDDTIRLKEDTMISMDPKTGDITNYTKKPEYNSSENQNQSGESDEEDPVIATKMMINFQGSFTDYEKLKDPSDGIGMMEMRCNSANSDMYQNSYDAYSSGPSMYSGYQNPSMSMNSPSGSSASAVQTMQKIIDDFYPKKVFIKLKTPGNSEFSNEVREIKNLLDKGYNNIGIMFPGIHHNSFIEKIKTKSDELGINLGSFEFGICVDTPAACIMADEFKECGIKFISIDIDKLIRSTLGLKDDAKTENYEMHPAILKLLKSCIKNYRYRKIYTSIHGSIKNQHFIEKLIEYHIDSISVNPDNFRMLKYVAARTEKKMILDAMMQNRYGRNFKE